MFDYAARRARLDEEMARAGIETLFLGPSADLEYLTGVERGLPSFSEVTYAHGWVVGAFFRPGENPVFVLPRMFATFDLHAEPEGELIVVSETDDGRAIFERVARAAGRDGGVVAIGDRIGGETVLELGRVVGLDRLQTGSRLINRLRRVKSSEELEAMTRAIAAAEKTMAAVTPLVVPGVSMGELAEAVDRELSRAGSRCPSFTTHVLTGFGEHDYDSAGSSVSAPIPEGASVMFDFGGVVDGYCSDFGRTIYCGEPPDDVREAYAVLLEAHEEGRRALRVGALAKDVNAACRRPIEDAGLGPYFRHRMGHGIGLNVHERPFISPEDDTPLERGMTFTDEPSLNIPGRFSVRIEDIVVCEEEGGRLLNAYPSDLVANR
jgi:Xaa-Pro aminopeptidase